MQLDEKALEKARDEFQRQHADCCYPTAMDFEATEAAGRIIACYLTSLPSAHGELVERLEKYAAEMNGHTKTLCLEAAAALREKEGFLWCCHVRGPDDVIPTVDYASALKMADEINDHIRATDDARARLEAIAKQKPDQNWPKVSAVPAPWPWSAEAHAKGLLASNRFRTAEPPTGGSHG